MDDVKNCKISACCKGNMCGIAGMILIVLATILTLYTLSGLGIFAMFLVGVMMGCHKHLASRGCGCGCRCCKPEDTCGGGVDKGHVPFEHNNVVPPKNPLNM